jgi:hypothetical protein
LNNLGVIPGKLAIAGATRNPGKSKTSGYPLSRVMTTGRSLIYFANFSSMTLGYRLKILISDMDFENDWPRKCE